MREEKTTLDENQRALSDLALKTEDRDAKRAALDKIMAKTRSKLERVFADTSVPDDPAHLKDAFNRVNERAAADKKELGEEKARLASNRDAKARARKELAVEVRQREKSYFCLNRSTYIYAQSTAFIFRCRRRMTPCASLLSRWRTSSAWTTSKPSAMSWRRQKTIWRGTGWNSQGRRPTSSLSR